MKNGAGRGSAANGVGLWGQRKSAQKDSFVRLSASAGDRGDAFNVLVKPDMKNAPVQVTRAGGQVNIKTYVNFTGTVSAVMTLYHLDLRYCNGVTVYISLNIFPK